MQLGSFNRKAAVHILIFFFIRCKVSNLPFLRPRIALFIAQFFISYEVTLSEFAQVKVTLFDLENKA